MSKEMEQAGLTEKERLEKENIALQEEITALRLKEENHTQTIQAQNQELEKLRTIVKALQDHFLKNGPAWQVERCVGCGKCDYMLLEESLVKAQMLSK